MSKGKRYTQEFKVEAVKQITERGYSAADVAERLGISSNSLYNWQKQLFENAAPAFERRTNKANKRRQEDAAGRKISQLEEKLQNKNEVISELMEENIRAKKANGER